MRYFLKIYTRLGDGFIWIIAILYLGLKMGWSEFFGSLTVSVISIVLSITLYWTIKLSIKRPRPFNAIDGVKAEVPPLDKYSFPSGHTMNNLSVGLVVGIQHPELIWATVGLPITWGFLRIYFGVHYFTDIIAGILLGTFCGWTAFAIAPKIEAFIL
jgi:undecaprenyl-diphosphatase